MSGGPFDGLEWYWRWPLYTALALSLPVVWVFGRFKWMWGKLKRMWR